MKHISIMDLMGITPQDEAYISMLYTLSHMPLVMVLLTSSIQAELDTVLKANSIILRSFDVPNAFDVFLMFCMYLETFGAKRCKNVSFVCNQGCLIDLTLTKDARIIRSSCSWSSNDI